MKFVSHSRETVILNPTKDMKPKTIPSEIRIDPLTGRSARICHFMKLEWPTPDFDDLVAGTEATCPFCPDRVLKITPCFPQNLFPEGRLMANDCVLFPNIAPYDSLSAVATLGSDHYVPMNAFSRGRITNGLDLAMTFFRRVHAAGHPESVFHIVNWNYMPPAGSSLIHPHLQVFATSFAPNLMRWELDAARNYRRENNRNYWDDLVETEIDDGRRYLGTIGRTSWFSAFAPMGVAGDVLAVVADTHCTLDLTDADMDDIAEGLIRAMRAYEGMGIYSFNMNFFTGAPQNHHTRFHLLFSPRTFFNPSLGTPDIGALRNLFNETLCMAYPEEIADRVRPCFQEER